MIRTTTIVGSLLALASADETALAPPVTALAFSPAGTTLLAGSQAGLVELEWPELNKKRDLLTHPSLRSIHDVVFSPDGKTIAIAGGEAAAKGVLELRRWPSGEIVWIQALHEDVLFGVAWSGDGSRIACASADTTASISDSTTGKLLHRLRGHSRRVLAITFSPAGSEVITGGVDRSLRVWGSASGTITRALENHSDAVLALATRPQVASGANASVPSVASAGRDRTVRLWNPTIGRLVRFARVPASPLAIAWTADGRQIIVTTTDGRVHFIDPEQVRIVKTLRAVSGWACTVAVSASGEIAVGGEGGQIVRVPHSNPQADGLKTKGN